MNKTEIQQEALSRARGNMALTNYPAIFQGFMDKGISEDDIIPRENVLTYHAWKALGRQVLKGEKGVKVLTWIDCTKDVENKETGKTETVHFKRPKGATVFHISQTELV